MFRCRLRAGRNRKPCWKASAGAPSMQALVVATLHAGFAFLKKAQAGQACKARSAASPCRLLAQTGERLLQLGDDGRAPEAGSWSEQTGDRGTSCGGESKESRQGLEALGAQRCPGRRRYVMKPHSTNLPVPASNDQPGCRSKGKPSESASWRVIGRNQSWKGNPGVGTAGKLVEHQGPELPTKQPSDSALACVCRFDRQRSSLVLVTPASAR